jgi:hypothetical protein
MEYVHTAVQSRSLYITCYEGGAMENETFFGMQYLESVNEEQDDVFAATTCAPVTTYHLKSGTTTQELVCDD